MKENAVSCLSKSFEFRSLGELKDEGPERLETFLRSWKFFANSSTHTKNNLLSSRSAFADLLSLTPLKTNYYSIQASFRRFLAEPVSLVFH